MSFFCPRKSARSLVMLSLVALAVLSLDSGLAAAKNLPGQVNPGPGAGWGAFENPEFLRDVLVSLALATALGALIAYHPRTYGRATTLEELDQPKIFIMYAVVGAVIAEIVRAWPDMALVVFGIGGLLRFRTDAGPARDTGRVILVTAVGLCCGLSIFPVAIIATAFGWVLIYFLEARVTQRLVVKGLESENLLQAAEAYKDVLIEEGVRVLSEKKNFPKGQVAFVFRVPGRLNKEEMENLFKDLPPKLQGAVDWESS